MRKVIYLVGCNGYYTICSTKDSAEAQRALNPAFEIITKLEKIEAPISRNE